MVALWGRGFGGHAMGESQKGDSAGWGFGGHLSENKPICRNAQACISNRLRSNTVETTDQWCEGRGHIPMDWTNGVREGGIYPWIGPTV